MSINLQALAQAAENFSASGPSQSSQGALLNAAASTQPLTSSHLSSKTATFSPTVQKPPAPAVVRTNFLSQKSDWARLLTVEERQFIREKIKEAYKKNITCIEELLDTCAAMEEEFVYLSAPSRLDYFKNGIQYDKRILEKKKQLQASGNKDGEAADANQIKRPRTNSSDML